MGRVSKNIEMTKNQEKFMLIILSLCLIGWLLWISFF